MSQITFYYITGMVPAAAQLCHISTIVLCFIKLCLVPILYIYAIEYDCLNKRLVLNVYFSHVLFTDVLDIKVLIYTYNISVCYNG